MEFPNDLRYTPDHQWVRVEPDGTATVGITDFAQEELGEIVYVELPKVGDSVEQQQPFGEVESNKTSSDVYAPCSGEVVEINEALDAGPDLVNSDPYGDGWMIKVQPVDIAQLESLLDPAGYRQLVGA